MTTATAVAVLVLTAVCMRSVGEPMVRPPGDEWRLLHYHEGLSQSNRALENEQTGTRELYANSISIASTELWNVKIHKMLAHLPLLLHGQAQRALLVGFGSGMTAGAMMLHEVEADCAELEANQKKTTALFRHVNGDVLGPGRFPGFALHIDDGRNWLLTRNRDYDVVVRDALIPKVSQDLFSREFYELCKRRLKPGGIVCGFLPFDTAYVTKRSVTTFRNVFPHASLWYVCPQVLLLVGSDRRLDVDYQALSRRMAAPRIKRDLEPVHLGDPRDLLACFLTTGTELEKYAAGHETIVDNKPLGFVLLAGPTGSEGPGWLPRMTDELLRHRTSILPFVRNLGGSQSEAEQNRTALQTDFAAMEHSIRGQASVLSSPQTAAGELDMALRLRPDSAEFRYQYAAALVALAARATRAADVMEARALLAKATAYAPDSPGHYMLLGHAQERLGQFTQALEAYRKASSIQQARGYPPIPFARQRIAELEKLVTATGGI